MRSRSYSCRVLALVLLSCVPATAAPDKPPANVAPGKHAPANVAPETDRVRPWIGTWIFDEDYTKKQTEIETAIKSVAGEVPFFLEGFVSDKLMLNTNIAPGVAVSANGRKIRTKYVGASTFEGTLNTWVHTESDDVEFDVRFQQKGNRLHQHFRADNGGRRQTMMVLPNGRLRVDVEVYSKWLAKSLRFSLEYRRKN